MPFRETHDPTFTDAVRKIADYYERGNLTRDEVVAEILEAAAVSSHVTAPIDATCWRCSEPSHGPCEV